MEFVVFPYCGRSKKSYKTNSTQNCDKYVLSLVSKVAEFMMHIYSYYVVNVKFLVRNNL